MENTLRSRLLRKPCPAVKHALPLPYRLEAHDIGRAALGGPRNPCYFWRGMLLALPFVLKGGSMLKKYTRLAYVLGLIVMIAGATIAFAGSVTAQGKSGKGGNGQGKDKGGDRGNRGGNEGGKHENRGDFRGQGRGKHEVRQQEQHRVFSRHPSVPQPRSIEWNSRRPQQWNDQQSRRQQKDEVREVRRQQRDIEQQARRTQRGNNRNIQGPPQWTNWNWGTIQRQDVRRENKNDRFRRHRDDRRPVYVLPQNYNWNNVWNRSNGDDRHFAKEQRKFLKEQLKYQRKFQRDQQRLNNSGQYGYNPFLGSREYGRTYYYSQPITRYYPPYSGNGNYNLGSEYYNSGSGYYNDPVYSGNNYDAGYYGYGQGSSFKEQIIRTLISSVLGGLGGRGFDLGGLVQPQGYSNVVPYDYNGYDPSYGYYTPSYVSGRPYYGPAPNDQYYDQAPYDRPGLSGIGGSILGALPIAEIVQQYTGDNPFVSQLVGSFLSQGYDQGFLAGQHAREYGYDDAMYNDPYAYQNGAYDPYSASLGENRRYLSEGYELGYRDALNGNAMYDEQTVGGGDLVGVLLNNVLSGI